MEAVGSHSLLCGNSVCVLERALSIVEVVGDWWSRKEGRRDAHGHVPVWSPLPGRAFLLPADSPSWLLLCSYEKAQPCVLLKALEGSEGGAKLSPSTNEGER